MSLGLWKKNNTKIKNISPNFVTYYYSSSHVQNIYMTVIIQFKISQYDYPNIDDATILGKQEATGAVILGSYNH